MVVQYHLLFRQMDNHGIVGIGSVVGIENHLYTIHRQLLAVTDRGVHGYEALLVEGYRGWTSGIRPLFGQQYRELFGTPGH